MDYGKETKVLVYREKGMGISITTKNVRVLALKMNGLLKLLRSKQRLRSKSRSDFNREWVDLLPQNISGS